MTRQLIPLLFVLFAAFALGGCAVNEATLEGHDFLDQATANLRTGIAEYHADDMERMRTVRSRLAAAFAADVAAASTDRAAVEASTVEFLALLERAETAERIEQTRYRRLLDTLLAIGEVNASLRDLTQIKLGWKNEAVRYANTLRKKVQDGREQNRSGQ